MANKKISELPRALYVDGGNEVMINRDLSSRKLTLSQLSMGSRDASSMVVNGASTVNRLATPVLTGLNDGYFIDFAGSQMAAFMGGYILKSASSANSYCALAMPGFPVFASSGAAGFGGFSSWFRFAPYPFNASDGRFFIGFTSQTTGLSGSAVPSALPNCMGICKDTGDTNLQFVTNTSYTGVTKVSLGITLQSISLVALDVYISAVAETSSEIVLVNRETGTVYSRAETNFQYIPFAELYFQAAIGTGAGTTSQKMLYNSLRIVSHDLGDVY